MRPKFVNALMGALIFAGMWVPAASCAELQSKRTSMAQVDRVLTLKGKVVHVATGNFWGILGSDGKNYDPGTLPVAFQQPELQVQVEAKLVAKRPARMWGKAIEIVLIEPSALDHGAPAQHHHQETTPGYQRSVHDYKVPDVDVINSGGVAVSSASLFDTEKTVVVSFIFTSCTAICPILTATLTQTQLRLGSAAQRVRIVSISIDPDYDTPARLRDYARRFDAQGDWNFLTGERTALRELQQAFDADRGDKNNHQPLTLIRRAGQKRWVRLDGFTSAAELASEIQRQSET
jgi:protein SCO1/2